MHRGKTIFVNDHLVGAGDVDANVDHRPRSNSAIFVLTVLASLGAVFAEG